MADESCHFALVLLCGIPASGKSTLALKLQDYVQKIRGDAMHVIHVCYDDFIPFDMDVNERAVGSSQRHGLEMMVHENSSEKERNTQLFDDADSFSQYSIWKQYRKLVLETVDRALNTIESQQKDAVVDDPMAEGLSFVNEFWSIFQKNQKRNCPCFTSTDCRWDGAHVILVDDNLYYHSMRYEYVQLARKYSAGFVEVFLECPLEIAMKRNSSRPHPVSSYTMKTMSSKMEPPDPEKFPWEQHYLTLKTEEELSSETMECVTQLVLKAMKFPLIQAVEEDSEEKEKSRIACITSTIYQTDQVLRKYTTKVITEAKGNGKGKKELQLLVSQLNKDKKAFLESLHNIKTQQECNRKAERTRPSVGSCVVEDTEYTVDKTSASKTSTSDFQTERTAVTSAEKTFAGYATVAQTKDSNKEENNGQEYRQVSDSCLPFGTSRKHLCLQCFPNVEDKEEFKLFVEELFRQNFDAKKREAILEVS